jgi:hypothetical protein
VPSRTSHWPPPLLVRALQGLTPLELEHLHGDDPFPRLPVHGRLLIDG